VKKMPQHPQAQVAREELAKGDAAYERAARAMKAMHDDGLGQREIAEQVGCSQTKVSYLLRSLELHVTQAMPFSDAFAATTDKYHPKREAPESGEPEDPEAQDPEDPEDPSFEETASTLGIEDAIAMMHAGAQRMNELYAQETPQMRDRRMDMELEATEPDPVPETEVIRQRLLPLDTGGIERSYFRGMLEAARLLADVYPQSRDLDLAIEALEAQIAACQSKLHELQQQRRSQRHLSAVEGSD
jgi:hypothetical protein